MEICISLSPYKHYIDDIQYISGSFILLLGLFQSDRLGIQFWFHQTSNRSESAGTCQKKTSNINRYIYIYTRWWLMVGNPIVDGKTPHGWCLGEPWPLAWAIYDHIYQSNVPIIDKYFQNTWYGVVMSPQEPLTLRSSAINFELRRPARCGWSFFWFRFLRLPIVEATFGYFGCFEKQ